jgi:hypothetical protein
MKTLKKTRVIPGLDSIWLRTMSLWNMCWHWKFLHSVNLCNIRYISDLSVVTLHLIMAKQIPTSPHLVILRIPGIRGPISWSRNGFNRTIRNIRGCGVPPLFIGMMTWGILPTWMSLYMLKHPNYIRDYILWHYYLLVIDIYIYVYTEGLYYALKIGYWCHHSVTQ